MPDNFKIENGLKVIFNKYKEIENFNKIIKILSDFFTAIWFTNPRHLKKIINKYLELNSNVILPEIFKGYFKYLLSKNIKIDYINSAAELFYYNGISDRVSYYMNKTYDKYNEIFDNIIPSDTEFKSKCIKSLNSKCNIILKQELRNATITWTNIK